MILKKNQDWACKDPDTRSNSWIQFIGSKSWIQLSAWYTRSNSWIQYCKHESSNWSKNWNELDVNLKENLTPVTICVYCDGIGRTGWKKTNQFVFFSFDTISIKERRPSRVAPAWRVESRVIWTAKKRLRSSKRGVYLRGLFSTPPSGDGRGWQPFSPSLFIVG